MDAVGDRRSDHAGRTRARIIKAAVAEVLWDCGGKLPDGRFIQVAARVDSGRMTFDVVVKVA